MKTNYKSQKGIKLLITEKGRFHQVNIEDISHIVCDGHISIIKTIRNSNISTYKLLKVFEEELSNIGFVRVNRNTLVNLNNVAEYNNHNIPKIKLINNEVIKISRRRLNLFLKTISESNG